MAEPIEAIQAELLAVARQYQQLADGLRPDRPFPSLSLARATLCADQADAEALFRTDTAFRATGAKAIRLGLTDEPPRFRSTVC